MGYEVDVSPTDKYGRTRTVDICDHMKGEYPKDFKFTGWHPNCRCVIHPIIPDDMMTPALKAADIGCAMGITGTDVAKGAADMTLTDDNFATIVEAVREGRGIYANIKKVVGFLLGTNIGEVITVFAAMLLWHRTPFLSMQLLWINLVTDSLPAIALGMENVEADVMEKKPKPKNEGIFAHGLGIRVVLQGAMFAVLSLIAFWLGWQGNDSNLVQGQTMAFMVLALSQVVQSLAK